MTNSNETERTPGDDRIGSRLLTTNSIYSDFENYANRNDDFSSHEHMKIGLYDEWTNDNEISWAIGFAASHIYNGSRFTGNIFGITLELSSKINYYSDDFINAISDKEAYELPKINKLTELKLVHLSSFTINQNADLAWLVSNTYTTTEYIGENESGLMQHDKQYCTIEDMRNIEIMKPKSQPDASDSYLEISKGIQNVYIDDLAKELNGIIKVEAYLKRMHDVFLVFQRGDESIIDLSELMPASFLK